MRTDTPAFIVDRAAGAPRNEPWPEHPSYIHKHQQWQWRALLMIAGATLAVALAALAYGCVP